MSLEKKFSSTPEKPRIETLEALEAVVSRGDWHTIAESTKPAVAEQLIRAGLIGYVQRGDKVKLQDQTPDTPGAEENTLVESWNDILKFLDRHADSVSVVPLSEKDIKYAVGKNAHPVLDTSKLVVRDPQARDLLLVAEIDVMYEMYRHSPELANFLSSEFLHEDLEEGSHLYKLCKDKDWWHDVFPQPKGKFDTLPENKDAGTQEKHGRI